MAKVSSTRRIFVVLAAFAVSIGLLASQVAPLGAQEEAPHTPVLLDERDAQGEQCIVCRKPVHQGGIVEVRYKGRRFHVAAAMLDEFRADPERYFVTLEARSALFDEQAMETPQAHDGWLLFGLYVLAGLVSGALCAYLALGWGRPPGLWFVAGVVANGLALLGLLVAGRSRSRSAPRAVGWAKVPVTRAPARCPACGESNHPAAPACSSCGSSLDPAVEAESSKLEGRDR